MSLSPSAGLGSVFAMLTTLALTGCGGTAPQPQMAQVTYSVSGTELIVYGGLSVDDGTGSLVDLGTPGSGTHTSFFVALPGRIGARLPVTAVGAASVMIRVAWVIDGTEHRDSAGAVFTEPDTATLVIPDRAISAE